MTVLFVLMTLAFFLALDAWTHRQEKLVLATETAPQPAPEPEPLRGEPVWVGGYQVPDGLHFHRGHVWARQVGPDTAVVGIDDFARRLIGSVTRAVLPRPGTWLRAGDNAARLGVDGRDAELVSPIEGVVIESNALVERDPDLAANDPYGRGWLFKVRSSELGRHLRNLASGSLAHRFFEDSREKLQLELMALSGSVLADGGEPAADFVRHLSDEDWHRLTREFLLT